ncbi:60S ribosomal protein L3 [Fagus crenata]
MLATVKDESDDGKKDIQSQLEKMKKYCIVIRVLAHTQDESDDGKKDIQSQLEKMKKYCIVIRVLAHTQIRKMKGLKQKKAHLMGIQVNGGTIAQKVDYAYE